MIQRYQGIMIFLFSILFSIMFSLTTFAAEGENIQIGKKISGEITDSTDNQTHKINLKEPGLVSIDFSSYIDYGVKVQLEDNKGKIIVSNHIYGGKETTPKKWSASQYVEAGTYYIRVSKHFDYIGEYDLQVNFSATKNNEAEPNNGTVQAPLIKPNQQITGLISWNDHLDTYKIVLQEPGLLKLSFSSYIDYGVKVQVEDSTSERILSNHIYGGKETNPKKWSASQYLEAGTYYIHVSKYSNYTGKYELEIDFSATKNNEIEPNNGSVDAQALTLNEKITGLISWNDRLDTYTFTLSKPTKVILNMNSFIDFGVSVQLEDEQGTKVLNNRVYGGKATNPKKDTKWLDLKAGTYYIHVNKHSNYTGKYELLLLNQVNFKDVYLGTSYYDAVARLTSIGAIQGFGDNTFRPDRPLTRLDAILLISRALDLDAPNNYKEIADTFSDVGTDHRRAQEIAAVFEKGIFLGYSNKMGLSDQLTREQMASVIVRAFELQGNSAINHLDHVTDASEISATHRDDVETLYELGITKGKGKDTYVPKDSITRGEFAIFLDRTMN